MTCLLLGLAQQGMAADHSVDHLVPVQQKYGSSASYQQLWQKKLLITPGDIARFVSLPGNSGEEVTASVYQMPKKDKSLIGGYWLTVTQSSERLWDSVATPERVSPRDPQLITVARCDIALPQTTARALQMAWRTMLAETHPPATSDYGLDRSIELFSATNKGASLWAELPAVRGRRVTALLNIGTALIDLCNMPESRRRRAIVRIEDAALDLVGRQKKKKIKE
jgi:hypothetical protein